MHLRRWMVGVIASTLMASGCGAQNFQDVAPGTSEPAISQSVIDTSKKDTWPTDRTIKPTAIVLHWWAAYNGGGNAIATLIKGAESNKSTYNPNAPYKADNPVVGHVTVQLGVTAKGKAFQLTPRLDSFARHAKCANTWAIGVEIEGFGPGHKHYIGNNKKQFDVVVKVVRELMAKFDIPAESVIAPDGTSGRGIVSHAQVDKRCRWANANGTPGKGAKAGTGKADVDTAYLNCVFAAVGPNRSLCDIKDLQG